MLEDKETLKLAKQQQLNRQETVLTGNILSPKQKKNYALSDLNCLILAVFWFHGGNNENDSEGALVLVWSDTWMQSTVAPGGVSQNDEAKEVWLTNAQGMDQNPFMPPTHAAFYCLFKIV